jgi:hypothetical protein
VKEEMLIIGGVNAVVAQLLAILTLADTAQKACADHDPVREDLTEIRNAARLAIVRLERLTCL